MIMTVAHSEINSQTRLWLEKIVVGLDLCPFAAPVINEDRLRLEICDSSELEDMLSAVLRELDLLQQNDEHLIATSLLVFCNGLEEFDDFWSLVEIANELLQQVGLEGVIQIASFHPDYCFEGMAVDDASHYTNRSPFPMLHFIREEQLSRVLETYPNPEAIPENNIRRLQELGRQKILQLLEP
jgi:hypothetical protein